MYSCSLATNLEASVSEKLCQYASLTWRCGNMYTAFSTPCQTQTIVCLYVMPCLITSCQMRSPLVYAPMPGTPRYAQINPQMPILMSQFHLTISSFITTTHPLSSSAPTYHSVAAVTSTRSLPHPSYPEISTHASYTPSHTHPQPPQPHNPYHPILLMAQSTPDPYG